MQASILYKMFTYYNKYVIQINSKIVIFTDKTTLAVLTVLLLKLVGTQYCTH